jgi:hypothetical protein
MREGDRGTKWISVEIKLVEDEVKREIMLYCTSAGVIQLPNNISKHKHFLFNLSQLTAAFESLQIWTSNADRCEKGAGWSRILLEKLVVSNLF